MYPVGIFYGFDIPSGIPTGYSTVLISRQGYSIGRKGQHKIHPCPRCAYAKLLRSKASGGNYMDCVKILTQRSLRYAQSAQS